MGLKLWKMSLAAGALVLNAAQASALSGIYADKFYLEQGDYSKVSDTSGTRYNPNSALGNTSAFFSLGLGGIIALGFNQNFRGEAIVIEKTNGCTSTNDAGECKNYTGESASVWALSSNVTFKQDTSKDWSLEGQQDRFNYDLSSLIGSDSAFKVADLPNGLAQEGVSVKLSNATAKLGSLGYILIQDTSTHADGRDGFDLVSVKVQPVPVPAALPLFGLVAAGLGFAGWRKRKMA